MTNNAANKPVLTRSHSAGVLGSGNKGQNTEKKKWLVVPTPDQRANPRVKNQNMPHVSTESMVEFSVEETTKPLQLPKKLPELSSSTNSGDYSSSSSELVLKRDQKQTLKRVKNVKNLKENWAPVTPRGGQQEKKGPLATPRTLAQTMGEPEEKEPNDTVKKANTFVRKGTNFRPHGLALHIPKISLPTTPRGRHKEKDSSVTPRTEGKRENPPQRKAAKNEIQEIDLFDFLDGVKPEELTTPREKKPHFKNPLSQRLKHTPRKKIDDIVLISPAQQALQNVLPKGVNLVPTDDGKGLVVYGVYETRQQWDLKCSTKNFLLNNFQELHKKEISNLVFGDVFYPVYDNKIVESSISRMCYRFEMPLGGTVIFNPKEDPTKQHARNVLDQLRIFLRSENVDLFANISNAMRQTLASRVLDVHFELSEGIVLQFNAASSYTPGGGGLENGQVFVLNQAGQVVVESCLGIEGILTSFSYTPEGNIQISCTWTRHFIEIKKDPKDIKKGEDDRGNEKLPSLAEGHALKAQASYTFVLDVDALHRGDLEIVEETPVRIAFLEGGFLQS